MAGKEGRQGMGLKRFFIMAKDPGKGEDLKDIVLGMGFEWDEDNPDFVISLGGDGTYLMAERQLPGVPKLLSRDSMVCFKCHDEPVEEVLDLVRKGDYRIEEFMKLEAETDGEKLIAANDVIIRNKDPTRGLRFRVFVDDKPVNELFIGDGVIIATPFGSTGYYHAITRQEFHEGIGIAFSNPVRRHEPMVTGSDSVITVEVVRGEAQLAADNNPRVITVDSGGVIRITRSDKVARIVSHIRAEDTQAYRKAERSEG